MTKNTNKKIKTNLSFIESYGILIFLFLTFLIYGQTLNFEAVIDDNSYHLANNPYLNGESNLNIISIWLKPYEGLYIPLAYTLWAGIKALGSLFLMADAPSKFHLPTFHFFNLLFHALNTFLLFRLFRRWLDSPSAFLGALLFLVHPVQVESVAWISEFRGLSSLFFSLLFLNLFLSSLSNSNKINSWKYMGLLLLLFSAALLCKPSGIFLLPLCVSLLYLEAKTPRLWPWPLLGLMMGIALLTTLITHQAQMAETLAPSPLTRLILSADSLVFYLASFVWPFADSPSYAKTISGILQYSWPLKVLLLSLYPLSIALLFFLYKKQKNILLGLAFFLLPLVPLLGFITFKYQIHWTTVADRYMYAPTIGLCLLFGILLSHLSFKMRLSASSLLILLALFSGLKQVPIWANEDTLYTRAIELYPEQSMAYVNRALYNKQHGQYNLALHDLNDLLKMYPQHAVAHLNRGQVYSALKRPSEAQADLERARELDPKLDSALLNLGSLYFQQSNFPKALDYYNQYLNLHPEDPIALGNRANCHALLKESKLALLDFEHLLQIQENNLSARMSYAVTLFYAERKQEAKVQFLKVLDKNPKAYDAKNFITEIDRSF